MKSRRTADGLEKYCHAMYPRLVGFLGLHGLDTAAAEDTAHDALARVVQHWRQVRQMDSPDAWTYRVALNLSTSRWRRIRAKRRAALRARTDETSHDPDPVDRVALRRAVLQLPLRQRTALVLRYFNDLTVAESAVAMSGTVKALTSQGIDHLRELLPFDLSALEENEESNA